jgi:hypothetical protein
MSHHQERPSSFNLGGGEKSFEQRAEPQQIVATRLLYCLQYPVQFKSSAKDFPFPSLGIILLELFNIKPIFSQCQNRPTDMIPKKKLLIVFFLFVFIWQIGKAFL